VLEVGGEIDAHTAWRLRESLLDLPPVDVVADLSHVRFFGANGLRLLLQTRAHLAETGHTLSLAAAPHTVRRLITLTDLDHVLPCWPTVDEARAAAAAAEHITPEARDAAETGDHVTPQPAGRDGTEARRARAIPNLPSRTPRSRNRALLTSHDCVRVGFLRASWGLHRQRPSG
jgi:anti-sigma B factor antagonist